MRLIDAERLTDGSGVFSQCVQMDFNIGPYILVDDLIKVLDESPTAYDVDKVIEKMKRNEEDAIKSIMENGKTEFHLIKITDLKELFEAYTKEQIEIVKSGGGADD